MQKQKKRQKSKRAALNKSLNFTPADLQANQQGFISFQQKRRLRWRLLLSKDMQGGCIWLVMSAAIVASIYLFIQSFYANELLNLMVLCYLSPSLIIFYPGIQFIKNYWQDVTKDIRKGEVDCISGTVSYSPYNYEPNRYYLKVSGTDYRAFEVSPKVADLFKKNQHYHVYYTPESGTIVSYETFTPAPY